MGVTSSVLLENCAGAERDLGHWHLALFLLILQCNIDIEIVLQLCVISKTIGISDLVNESLHFPWCQKSTAGRGQQSLLSRFTLVLAKWCLSI